MIGAESIEPNTPPLEIVKVPPSISSTANYPFEAFYANSPNVVSTSAKLFNCTSLIIGTTNPLGDDTATEISIKLRFIISLPSEEITELTMGRSYKALVDALIKKDISPSFAPCLFKNSSPRSFHIFIISDMSTS